MLIGVIGELTSNRRHRPCEYILLLSAPQEPTRLGFQPWSQSTSKPHCLKRLDIFTPSEQKEKKHVWAVYRNHRSSQRRERLR